MEPKLASPGAGLPKAELLVARALFAWRQMRGNRDFFTANFKREREAIRALVRDCNAESGARRVLIDRVPGLEDSSRYWSVWMTLEHLRIIHTGIGRTIGALARGVVPPGKASTAAVKPKPDIGEAVVGEYEKSCDKLLETVAAVPNLKTTARFAHPWFGPLDAAGWHAMAGTHLAIHREQIKRILKRLAAPPS
ncbi:MAG TPA: DinB family protein [Candidatus Acidoferrales bacterium]|nr:DinB family protein [Candidatus Acidoferrales bacterium]